MPSRQKAEDEALILSFGHYLDRRSPPLSLASIGAYQADVRLYAEFLRTRGAALIPPDGPQEEAYLALIERTSISRTVQRKATALRYFRDFWKSIRWPTPEQVKTPEAPGEQPHPSSAILPSGAESLAAFAAAFVSSQGNPRTRLAYSVDLRKLVAAFEGRSPASLTGDEIALFLEDLKPKLKPSSVRRLNATVRAFFSWLAANGCRDRLVIRYAVPPPVPASGRLAARKLREVVSRIRKLALSARDEVIVRLLKLGMTPVEIVSLRVEDIDLTRQRLTVRSKRQRARFLSIDSPLSTALRDCRNELQEPTGALIVNARGSALTTRSIGRLVSRFAKRAGLAASVNPQALRRASAEAVILEGGDALDVKHALGLAGASVTRKYL